MRFCCCRLIRGPICTILLALAGGAIPLIGLLFGADDTTPPELKSLAFTPASITTSARPAEVTINFTATDDASGAAYFELTFVDPSATVRQSASAKFAPTLSGTHSVRITFPRFSVPGAWTLSKVFLSDAAGNTSILGADDLSSRGFPTRLEVISAQDTVGPKLAALEFSPSQIDTSAGPAEVKLNYTATDDLSGVNYIELSFVSPSGVAKRQGSARFEPALSVSNSMTVTFPRLSDAGQWTLNSVFLSDAAGNTLVLDREGIERMGLRTGLEVRSATDTTPPALTGIHFAPEAIDTSQSPAMVNVDITATDDLSGVNYVELSFVSPSGVFRHSGSAKFDPAQAVTKSIPVTFPAHSEAGQWVLSNVFLADAAGNTSILDAEGVARSGFLARLEVKSALDTIPPTLTSFTLSPDAIDTSREPATVTAEFRATDNLSGVKSAEIVLVSPSGNSRQRSAAAFAPEKEMTGSVQLTFPRGSEQGAWRVASFILTDAAGNTLVLDAEAMASRVLKNLQVR